MRERAVQNIERNTSRTKIRGRFLKEKWGGHSKDRGEEGIEIGNNPRLNRQFRTSEQRRKRRRLHGSSAFELAARMATQKDPSQWAFGTFAAKPKQHCKRLHFAVCHLSDVPRC